jgi:hypothetical protein
MTLQINLTPQVAELIDQVSAKLYAGQALTVQQKHELLINDILLTRLTQLNNDLNSRPLTIIRD